MAPFQPDFVTQTILILVAFAPWLGPLAVLISAGVSRKLRPELRRQLVEDPHPVVEAWGSPDRAAWFTVSRRLLPSRWLRSGRVLPVLLVAALCVWIAGTVLLRNPWLLEGIPPLLWWVVGGYLGSAAAALIGDTCVLGWRLLHPPSYAATEQGLYLFDSPTEGEPGGEFLDWTNLYGWRPHPAGFTVRRRSIPPFYMEEDEIPPSYEVVFLWVPPDLRPRLESLLRSRIGER
jgi:hypothetical protein